MNINLDKKENKIILKVTLKFRGKRGETRNFTNTDAKNWIMQNNPEIKLGNVISAPSKPINNVDRLTGVWTFELQKEKSVDIPKKSVRIETQIEADPPIVEEPKEEASLSSEPLPYGLKSTRTKKKKKTKKETTEE